MTSSAPISSDDPLVEHKVILALIHKFLSGIKLRDPELMHSCILPSGHALLIRPVAKESSSVAPPRQHLQITLPEVIDRIPFDSPVTMEENIALTDWEEGDDGEKYGGRKSEVRVDNDIALAWTPYEVRLGGVLHHVGTNAFSFVRRLDGPEEGNWVISYVGDTFRDA
ncbi:hypothetical protein BKA65DRAFT_568681 [Rhexocercosporidium sp. MPI-PUGE-AT-0058]|nr:hypothetical protein BKA65DRAFT_568681 [Rhexocercosporidium sp. MPI-PUGE-AT-0058]